MKRPVITALFLCAVATLAGCPIYDHEDAGCYRSSDCAPGYSCDDRTGDCVLPSGDNTCRAPDDCGVNETCSRSAQCVAGDCSFSGCVSGYRCSSSTGVWACVASTGGAAGEGGAAGSGALAGAGGDSTGGVAGEGGSR